MTTYYVDSHGSNTSPYDTWAKAATTLAAVDAVDAAGDTIYVAHNHAESTGSNLTYSWAGTLASPTKIVCGNTGAAPPTATATTATVETAGNFSIVVNNGALGFYCYGLTFTSGTGSTQSNATLSASSPGGVARYESCSFREATTFSGRVALALGSTNAGLVELYNCTFKFGDAGQCLSSNGNSSRIYISGGSLLAGGVSPTALIDPFAGGGSWLIEGFDLSNASATVNLINTTAGGLRITFKNCKLPSSWSGSLHTGTLTGGSSRFELNNTDGSNTNYRLWINDAYGDITNESALVRTGGANDGTNGLSWKFVTTANAKYQSPLTSSEFVIWNDTTGSSKTVTVEFLHDSVTALKDNEIWIEVDYLGETASPLGTFITDASSILAAGASQDSSSVTWTTTGMTNPNTQRLGVTFTPQKKGFIHARVKVAKASYTLYVDPLITVS